MATTKATIIEIGRKKEQQILDDIAMTPSERIDKMFFLMELSANLKPSKTLLDSDESNRPYILLKGHGSVIQK